MKHFPCHKFFAYIYWDIFYATKLHLRLLILDGHLNRLEMCVHGNIHSGHGAMHLRYSLNRIINDARQGTLVFSDMSLVFNGAFYAQGGVAVARKASLIAPAFHSSTRWWQSRDWASSKTGRASFFQETGRENIVSLFFSLSQRTKWETKIQGNTVV